MGTMLSILCQITQIPISWKRSELGARIQWIGWLINFRAGTISIPHQKIDKLTSYLHEMLKSSKTSRKALEKLIGLLMWLTQTFPLMCIWFHHFYQDLYTVPATHFSIDAGDWPRLHEHLSDNLTFVSRPHQSAIPIGSTLLAVRHQSINTKKDLQQLHISTDKRIWLRLKDPGSSRRTIREDSFRMLKLFQRVLFVLNHFGQDMPQLMHVPLKIQPNWVALSTIRRAKRGLQKKILIQIFKSFHFRLIQLCRKASQHSRLWHKLVWSGSLPRFFLAFGFQYV